LGERVYGARTHQRSRLNTNEPEKRRGLILDRLGEAGCCVQKVCWSLATDHPSWESGILSSSGCGTSSNNPRGLGIATTLGVISSAKTDFLASVHAKIAADPSPEPGFISEDSTEGDVRSQPYFFVRSQPPADAPIARRDLPVVERRLAWHATDALTPMFGDTASTLDDDVAVCTSAVRLVLEGREAYALTTHPGHHASYEHYGGYSFTNNAVLVVRMLERQGKRPFLFDVDYHAGDGSASFFADADSPACASFASLHAAADYPFLPRSTPWAITVPPGASWAEYEPLLDAHSPAAHPSATSLCCPWASTPSRAIRTRASCTSSRCSLRTLRR